MMLKPATTTGLQFLHAWRQSQGRRQRQEDFCQTSPPTRGGDAMTGGSRVLIALADGMGGHTSGQIASRTVCDGYVRAFSDDPGDVGDRMADALLKCNDAVAQAIATDPSLAGMGSTLVAAFLDSDGLRWVSVGDSTLMLYRDGILQRLNADHSHGAILDQQAAAGIISEEIARADTRRRALHSAITGQPIPLHDLALDGYPLLPGDWVILASDGLLTLSGDEIATLIHDYSTSTPDRLVAALIEAVDKCGEPNQDNTTVAALCVVAATAAGAVEGGATSATAKTTRIVANNAEAPAAANAGATDTIAEDSDAGSMLLVGLGVLAVAAVAVLWLMFG